MKPAIRQALGRVDLLIALALGALALSSAWWALSPSSLWFDDAWVALVSRADGFGEALLPSMTAPGFTLLLYGWFSVVGFSETAAQILPLAAGVLVGPIAYLIVRRHSIGLPASVLSGLLLVGAPVLVRYSTRVKQFTIDALFALVLVAIAWLVIEQPDRWRRWLSLTVVGIVATMISTAVMPVVAAGMGAGLLAARRSRISLRTPLVAGTSFAVFGLVWAKLVILPSVNPGLAEFWEDAFLSVPTLASDIVRAAEGVTNAIAPGPWPLTMLAILLAAAWLVIKRPLLAIVLFGPLAVAFLLALARLAPLGGGRTDAYLFPGLALALAVTFDDVLTEWVPHRLAAGIGIGVVVIAAAPYGVLVANPAAVLYPQEDLRPLIAQWEAEGAPDETVLVYAGGEYAFALYTTIHVDLIDSQTSFQGFRPVINDDRIVVMESNKSEPERHGPLLMVALEQSDSFWFIGSHPGQDLDHIRGQFEQLGYREVDSFTRPGKGTDPGAWLSYWRRS